MSAAVMSPLGTMHEEEEALEIVSPLLRDQQKPMMKDDDDDESIPSLSEDNFADFDMGVMNEEDSKPAAASFGGLNNLGNTCYLNSAIQMLASLDSFRLNDPEQKSLLHQEFLDIRERLQRGETVNPAEFKKAVDARSPLFVGYRQQDSHEFLTTLLDLLDKDYKSKSEDDGTMELENDSEESKQDESEEHAKTTAPRVMTTRHLLCDLLPPTRSLTELQNDDICKLLHGGGQSVASKEAEEDVAMVPQCKLVGGRAALPMSGVTQLTSTLSAPEDELAAAVPDSTQASAEEEIEEDREPTPIEEFFTTEIRAQLTCDSCKHTRSHVEKYLHLSLDIGSESGSVEEGLRKFFSPENREIKCEKCFCETATQTLEISKLPRALLVHCKRFLVDISPDYSNITYRKNQSPFSFSDSLSASPDGILGEFLADDVDVAAKEEARWALHDNDDEMGVAERSYRIRSVVNHIGSSASCGHYTCDASRLYPNGERQWTRFNDARVFRISVEDAMGASAQRTAYMVMYELE